MTRFAWLLVLAAGNVLAADAAVDIDTAAKIYQAAAVREQVRASLVTMPKQIRDMFSRDVSTRLTDEQLAAVDAAAAHGFRIDVFETPALSALAQNLDAATVAKIEAFPPERSGQAHGGRRCRLRDHGRGQHRQGHERRDLGCRSRPSATRSSRSWSTPRGPPNRPWTSS